MATTCKRCGCEIWAPVAVERGYCYGCERAVQIREEFARTVRVDAARIAAKPEVKKAEERQ